MIFLSQDVIVEISRLYNFEIFFKKQDCTSRGLSKSRLTWGTFEELREIGSSAINKVNVNKVWILFYVL